MQLNHSEGTTIPALPCVSLEETLAFWQLLDFEVTYRQKAPNSYGVIRRGNYELHFFGLNGLKPEENFSTCLVLVPDMEQLHASFSRNLRLAFNRVPGTGLPRISRMKPGQTRFTVTDPAGNSVIFIKLGKEDAEAAEAYRQPGQTRLQRAVSAAMRLRDFKNDDRAAARLLDVALGRDEEASLTDRFRAVDARLELALHLDEPELASELQAELEKLSDLISAADALPRESRQRDE